MIDPVGITLLTATLASTVAALAGRIIQYFLRSRFARKVNESVTITTDAGRTINVSRATNLSEDEIKEIVAKVVQRSKSDGEKSTDRT